MQIQVLRTRPTGVQHPPSSLERRRLKWAGKGAGKLGTVLLRGLVFKLLNIRKTTSKKRFIV